MNFSPSAHQAAGHDGCLTAGPVFAKLTTPQELAFYAEAKTRAETHAAANGWHLGFHLADWIPSFMGTLTQGGIAAPGATVLQPEDADLAGLSQAQSSDPEKQYLVLENLYHGIRNPCILDIKLGAVLTDESVSEEKRLRLQKVSAETTSGSLSFRICGLKVANFGARPQSFFAGMENTIEEEHLEEGSYLKFNKQFGRALNAANVDRAFECFFGDSIPQRKALLTRFHQRLQLLYNCLLDSEVRIKSGSLLFVYEGNPERWPSDAESYFESDPLIYEFLDDSDDEGETGPLSRLNLIDFAHAKFTDGAGPDENIIAGVENLLVIFEKLIQSA